MKLLAVSPMTTRSITFYPISMFALSVFVLSITRTACLKSQIHNIVFAEQRRALDKSQDPPSFCSEAGWNQEWADEFLEDKLGSSWETVTSADTQVDHSAPVSGLGVTACRSARCRPENVRLENGHLILRSERSAEDPTKFFTGAVTTRGLKNWKDDVPYRLCVSAKLPGTEGKSRGMWPAHWMLPDNGLSEQCLDEGEVDLMEMINGDGGAYSTYHYMSSWPNISCGDFNTYHKSRNTLTQIPHWNEHFHEFAVERSKDHITYAIDGRVVHHVPADRLSAELSHSPFFLILNTAVGGSWPGEPTAETKLPAEHVIDYVRVSRRSVDAPKLSMLSYPLGKSADDIGAANLAKSASWADAWRPASLFQASENDKPPPPISMAHLEK